MRTVPYPLLVKPYHVTRRRSRRQIDHCAKLHDAPPSQPASRSRAGKAPSQLQLALLQQAQFLTISARTRPGARFDLPLYRGQFFLRLTASQHLETAFRLVPTRFRATLERDLKEQPAVVFLELW